MLGFWWAHQLFSGDRRTYQIVLSSNSEMNYSCGPFEKLQIPRFFWDRKKLLFTSDWNTLQWLESLSRNWDRFFLSKFHFECWFFEPKIWCHHCGDVKRFEVLKYFQDSSRTAALPAERFTWVSRFVNRSLPDNDSVLNDV